MFPHNLKYLFSNDNLFGLPTGVFPPAGFTEDLLATYQKSKTGNIQYIEEKLSQIKLNNFFHRYNVLILKHLCL